MCANLFADFGMTNERWTGGQLIREKQTPEARRSVPVSIIRSIKLGVAACKQLTQRMQLMLCLACYSTFHFSPIIPHHLHDEETAKSFRLNPRNAASSCIKSRFHLRGYSAASSHFC